MSLSEADKRKVGGSDIAALIGLDPRRSAVGVYARIVHGVDTPDNPAMRRGRILEPAVLEWYGEETGRTWERGGVSHEQRAVAAVLPSHLRASFDAFSWNGPGPARVVEAKTVGRNGLDGWGDPGTAEIPDGYALQCHWYAGILDGSGLGVDHVVDVPVLLAGDLALYQVQYDPEIFGQCREAADRFWRDHVVPRRPPPDVPLPADEALVKRIRREQGPAAVHFDMLSPEARLAVSEHLILEQNVSKLAAKSSALKTAAQVVVAELGAGGVVGLPADTGHSAITWHKRKGVTKTDWEAVAGDIASRADLSTKDWDLFKARHTTTSEPTRVWRPVPLKESKE